MNWHEIPSEHFLVWQLRLSRDFRAGQPRLPYGECSEGIMPIHSLNRRGCTAIVALCIACSTAPLGAQGTPPKPPPRDSTAKPDSAAKLEAVQITADRAVPPPVPALQLLTLPVSATVTARTAEQTVNLVDPEDAVKYLPSVFLRKRNYGDTQATVATRVWGVSSSARSLIFADGVPLSALIANNNNIGGPRWGLISPEEISRIDMMYGPYSAAYAGNSMGAVMEISTRQPDSLEASVEQTEALQRFSLYGTPPTTVRHRFVTNATLGDRFGKFSFWVSGSYQDSHSQPLLYVTSTSFPPGTTGGYAQQNKLGAAADVIGATGLLHTGMTNAKVKLAYDITSWLRASYTFAHWQNDGTSGTDSYIRRNRAHRRSRGRAWDSRAATTTSSKDIRRTALSCAAKPRRTGTSRPLAHCTGSTKTSSGIAAHRFIKRHDVRNEWPRCGAGRHRLDLAFDLKGAWHRGGPGARHTLSFGVHDDFYRLLNPTYNTPDWRGGAFSSVATEGDGDTQTGRTSGRSDAWLITPELQFTTLGGRYEIWRQRTTWPQHQRRHDDQPAD